MKRGRQGIRALRVRAAYSLGELARAASMDHRTLKLMLADCGVEFQSIGRITFVLLTQLQEKAFPLWEAIRTVQSLESGLEGRDPGSAQHPRHPRHREHSRHPRHPRHREHP